MEFAYFFAILTGFVFAGFVSSLWPLMGQREVSFGLLYPASHLLPLELPVVVFSTPVLLLKLGVALFNGRRFNLLAAGVVVGSVLAGFFQGVVVLSLMYVLLQG